MPTSLMLGLAAVFGSLFLVVLGITTRPAAKTGVARSLDAIGRVGARPMDQRMAEPFSSRVLAPGMQRMLWLGVRLSPSNVIARINSRLELAGNPGTWTAERILAYKGMGLIVGGTFGLLLSAKFGLVAGLVVAVGFPAFSFFVPDILLYNAGSKRQQLLQKALPDSLDLLTISVEAGLGFDAALSQVARNTEGPVAAEFFRVLQERQIGKSRSQSFRELGERTSVPEFKAFAASLVQADSLGIPIATVLREQSKEMRVKRRQRAEEAAQKVPVKILFPLIFFILPSLFVVVIGPGVLSIIKAFSH